MKTIFSLVSLWIVFTLYAQIPSKDWQIETAILAAPDPFRAEATVMGYDQSGKLTVLKTGTNHMICLADDPNKKGFSVSAYHKDLEPFMARGRELQSEGKGFKEIFDARESEVKSGQLKIPQGSTLFVLTGEVEAVTNQIIKTYLRYVVYIPFATQESTGLPLEPIAQGAPWLMDPGTHRAHIMISPAKN